MKAILLGVIVASSSLALAAGTQLRGVGQRELRQDRGRVVGRVKVVGSDAGRCEGKDLERYCERNMSVSARKYADGTVEGQLQDVFPGKDRMHASVDDIVFCPDGKKAIVCSKITDITLDAVEVGTPISTFVWDGGKKGVDYYSTNLLLVTQERVDLFSEFADLEVGGNFCDEGLCAAAADVILEQNNWKYEHIGGQVTVQPPDE